MRREFVPNFSCEMLNKPLSSLNVIGVGGTKRIFRIPEEKGRYSTPLPDSTPSQAVQDGKFLVRLGLRRPCAPHWPDLPNSEQQDLPSKSC